MEQTFLNRKIAVIGLGIEGLSSAKYLSDKGAHVTILDQKEEKQINRSYLDLLRKMGINTIFGKEYLDELAEYEMIVRSPGVKRNLAELKRAAEKGIVITSQTQLFLELCPGKIIGVTGTKGKGTTSSLIYEMLKKQGIDAYLGGNIGLPPFAFLDTLNTQSITVLELSSFQLQDVTKSPHIAVVLMITSEHQDYHESIDEYIDAKRNILRFQTIDDFAVINRDYVASHESDIYTDARIFQVSRERGTDEGCYAIGPTIFISKGGSVIEVIEQKDILLPGAHNLENVCAAVMAANVAGVQTKHIVEVLKTFKGLEHRLELVGEVNGVNYYDDSFSTTPETAIAAIEAFSSPEILILGGSSKNSDFSELGKVIGNAKNIKAIIGIGDEWLRIKEQIVKSSETRVVIEGAQNMQTIVAAASKIATPGDVVLLSPACASFGMFENYKDRGSQFKREVEKL